MKNLLFCLLIASGLLFNSCNEDEWLKPKPLSIYTGENVYVDKDGFMGVLYSIRDYMKADHHNERHFICSEMSASDLGVPLVQLDFRKLTPNMSQYYPFLSMFISCQVYLKDCNVVISRIDDIEWDNENERNAILAEAYWHRAYWYYRLIHNYGDVPYVGAEIDYPKLDFATYSRWTILDKIQSDLEFAVKHLPSYENTDPGGVSVGAGYHLLTKVYLANSQFDKAIDAATQVINGPYSLMKTRFGIDVANPDYNLIWDLHRPENFSLQENKEGIYVTIDRFDGPAGTKTGGLKTMRNYACGWWYPGILDSEGKQGMSYNNGGFDYKALYGEANPNLVNSPYYRYDIWTYGGESWKNSTDLRRADKNWLDLHELLYNNPGSKDYGKVVDYRNFGAPSDTFYYTYAFPHYITYVPYPDPNINPMGGNGDWYVFRLADTYLLRAEAYFWKNKLAEAAADINEVRSRANAKTIAPNEVTIDFIFDERARELFAEEPRHSELNRVSYIMAKQNMNGYTLENFSSKSWTYDRIMKHNAYYGTGLNVLANVVWMEPHHVLWPIPQEIITANTQRQINQNIGYDGAEKNIPPLTSIE